MEGGSFTLYPICVDSQRSQKAGRKYAKTCCVKHPKYSEVKGALDKLHLEYIPEPSKRHPRDQSTSGRFRIKKTASKSMIVESISKTIAEMREGTVANNAVPNTLNLVPIRKKKGKKK